MTHNKEMIWSMTSFYDFLLRFAFFEKFPHDFVEFHFGDVLPLRLMFTQLSRGSHHTLPWNN